MYATTKLSGKYQQVEKPTKGKQENPLNTVEEQCTQWAEWSCWTTDHLLTTSCHSTSKGYTLTEEIKRAIKLLKNGKAAVAAEALKVNIVYCSGCQTTRPAGRVLYLGYILHLPDLLTLLSMLTLSTMRRLLIASTENHKIMRHYRIRDKVISLIKATYYLKNLKWIQVFAKDVYDSASNCLDNENNKRK